MKTSISVVFTTAALLLLTLITPLNAIDIESAKERPCMEAPKTVPADMDWIMSHKTWYYPLMSRLDLYLIATSVSGEDPKDLTEDELYYDSCLKFKFEGEGYAGYGFNGLKKSFTVKPIPGMDAHDEYTEEGEHIATCYTTLTDNSTFIFATCCTDLQQQTWGVISPLKKLPNEILEMGKEHAKSLGFKSEFFTGLRYDHCEEGKSN